MKDVTQQKLRAANNKIRQLRKYVEYNDELEKQRDLLRQQLSIKSKLLETRYKDITRLQNILNSAENTLIQKDATIQKLQGMIKSYIIRDVFPVSQGQELDDPQNQIYDDYDQYGDIEQPDVQGDLDITDMSTWPTKTILLNILDKISTLYDTVYYQNDREFKRTLK